MWKFDSFIEFLVVPTTKGLHIYRKTPPYISSCPNLSNFSIFSFCTHNPNGRRDESRLYNGYYVKFN